MMKVKPKGSWVQVGKHQARQMQATGQCDIPNVATREQLLMDECGIVTQLPYKYDNVSVVEGHLVVPFYKTFLYDREVSFNNNLIPIGFSLLDKWEIAVPIKDYNVLARDIGTEEDRKKTLKITGDLRIPVYETGIMFVRKTEDTERLFELLRGEEGDMRLAFLRVLYQVKPYILALPTVWL
jgi:hypothetical protein